MRIAALDVGGTAIKYGLWDGTTISATGEISSQVSTARQLITLMEQAVCALLPVDAIGISTRGQVNGEGEILFDNGPVSDYTGTPLKAILEERFGVPVAVENDVNAAAWGEACLGAGQGAEDFLCLTFGTGIGGAIILNGNLYRGSNWSSGEFGAMHLFSQQPASDAADGAFYEHFASASALVTAANAVLPEITTGRQVCDHLEHPLLIPVVEQWIRNVSYGLSSLIHIFNPKLMVLGGGILQNDQLFQRMDACTRSLLMPGFECVTLLQAQLGNQAGMIGAAMLAQKIL